MKTINYTGSSKLISRIVNLLNRKAPLPLDGNGDPDWGTNGQVLSTDGNGSTAWVNQGGGGSGGHTIWGRLKATLTQRGKLWFADANASDASADDATKVEVVTELLNETAFDNLATDGTADGIYTFPDSGGEYLTADMVGYNNESVGDALDDKVSKSGDTIDGDLKVKRSTSANSALELGNAATNSYGLLTLYDGSSGYRANLYANNLSASRSVIFPNKSGTLLVDEDIKIVKAQSGSSNNAVITVPSAYPYATFEIVTPLMLYVGACASTGAISTIKGLDGTTPTVSGNNVTVYVGSYYRTAVLKLYPSAAF